MTRTLLKLHRTLLWRTMKTNAQIAALGFIVVLYTLIGLFYVGFSLGSAISDDNAWHALSGAVAVGTGAYVVAALVFPNGENHISPAQLASLPLTPRQVLPGMAAATLFTSRGFSAILATTVTTVQMVWLFVDKHMYVSAVATVPVMLAALAITIILGELVVSLGRGMSRQRQETSGVISLVLGFAAIFGFTFLTNAETGALPLADFGPWLAWTPLAAAPGGLASALSGNWLTALAQAAIAIATIVIGIRVWARLTRRDLEAPLDTLSTTASTAKKQEENTKFPLLLPGQRYGQAAMIFARAMRYHLRDSRMMAAYVMLPILGALFVVQAFTIAPGFIYVGAIFLGVLVAIVGANDFGADGPGTAAHMLAGVPARTLVVARHAAAMFPAWLVLVIYWVVMLVLADDLALAVLVIIASVGAGIASSSLAVFLTAFNPYPMSPPGTNPWADKSGNNASAYVTAFAALLLTWIPIAPGLIVGAIGYFGGGAAAVAGGVVLVLAIPVALYAVCAYFAIRRVDTKLPEIYAKVGKWAN